MKYLKPFRHVVFMVLSLLPIRSTVAASSLGEGFCPPTLLSAGDEVSLALGTNARVASWGWNGGGQLGNAQLGAFSNLPAPVVALTQAMAINGGGVHELALRSDRTIWAWGYNSNGQIGVGPAPPWFYHVPVPVVGLPPIESISAGHTHSLASDTSGQVWSWGENQAGEIGDGTTLQRDTPVQVPGLVSVSAVAAGSWFSVALKGDGTVCAWGNNTSGQMGNGSVSPSLVPGIVRNLSQVVAIASGQNHVLALTSDGSIHSWGGNQSGQLGIGTFSIGEVLPIRIPTFAGGIAVSAGNFHSMALRNDGTVWAWGYNPYGQLGIGTNGPGTEENRPVQVLGLTNIIAIAAGYTHSLALDGNGVLWAWGRNSAGELGIGRSTWDDLSIVPIQVLLDAPPRELWSVLLASRQGDDLVLDYEMAPWLAGYRLFADVDKLALGTTAITPDVNARTYVDVGAVTRPEAQYYQVRGLSLCTSTPGP